MNITVYCGARSGRDGGYKKLAEELGAWIALNGHGLVYGGGKAGLMGILADSVLAGGGRVFGIIPRFLVERESAHDRISRLSVVETMSERKKLMIEQGDAFIALPGGTGTLEEITEVMSLIRLKRLHKPCILFNYRGFYEPLRMLLNRMSEDGFYSPETLKVCFAATIDDISSFLLSWYVTDFAGKI